MENVVNRTRHELHDMQHHGSRTGKTIANIVIGTLVGAGAALLLAPKSGEQMRKDLAKQAHQLSDQATKFTDTAAKATRKQAKNINMPDLSKVTRRRKSSGIGKWIAGIAIGSALGAGVALLYAPKSGRQMRQELKREADEIGSRASHMARETADEARRKAREMANEAEGEMRRQKEIMEDVNNRDYPL
jgi:gas vesicle protein